MTTTAFLIAIADANEHFERVAARFHKETGYLAPGKNVSLAEWSEEYERNRQAAWQEFINKAQLTR
ncbi:MAG: hypothetical protein JWL61_4968 [Gemmatimonadetes bacterium]|nr:hypothetical protein [Gemmatimonadota bacterium]